MPESFLIKLQACSSIKKETLAQVFSCEFCEISKNTFYTKHLLTTASVAWELFLATVLFLVGRLHTRFCLYAFLRFF